MMMIIDGPIWPSLSVSIASQLYSGNSAALYNVLLGPSCELGYWDSLLLYDGTQ